ncbi:MAG: hypothetical protein H8E41_08110 [Desulfobulbaceae bacterium]|uniref:Uncharacterized protein n=1 Tax=Candidatus Desulfobia pelagia TaxID=2841692 RepID=A0A8J6TFR9_9BACT|nr:hypothetical protein [Candidatus Desulfobia pelagia]
MECQRLNKLVRSWYMQVQEESLAPARMVEFMGKHVMDCDVCLTDPNVRYEVKKITEIVLPPSKMTKQSKPDDEAKAEAKPVAPDTVSEDDEDSENDKSDDDDDDEEMDVDEDDDI